MTESQYSGAQFGSELRTDLCGGVGPKLGRETSGWMTSVPVLLSEGCTFVVHATSLTVTDWSLRNVSQGHALLFLMESNVFIGDFVERVEPVEIYSY